MTNILILILIISGNTSFSSTDKPSIDVVRKLYHEAVTEKKSCELLIELLEPYNERNSPLLLGYKASATMIMAKHAFNPFIKLSYFKEGRDMLQNAVEADKRNVELRFLRFAVQTNAPAFLGYRDHIRSDKTMLIKSVSKWPDPVLRKHVISYLKDSDYLSDYDKQILDAEIIINSR